MKNSKTIKKNKSLFVLTNTNNLTNYLAAGIILPKSASSKCFKLENLSNTNFVYAFESFSPSDAGYSDEFRETDNAWPVIIEIKSSVIDFFNKINVESQELYGNKFFLMPFIPLYFMKTIHFKTSDDKNNFMDIKFSNLDKNKLCNNKLEISENFFSDYKKNIYENLDEPTIPISQINVIDSIIGGIQVLIYLANKEKSIEKTKIYADLVKDIVNKNNNELIETIFGFNLIDVINKGVSSINSDDSLDLKIFKATILNLSTEAFQGINFDSLLIEEIIDSIPGSLFTKEENTEIENFINFAEDINSGKKVIAEDVFIGSDRSIIRSSLILLMTQVGKREFLDIIDLHDNKKVSEEIYICSLFLFGLFRNYTGLDVTFKSSEEEELINLSLVSGKLVDDHITIGDLKNSTKYSPSKDSKWYELSLEKETIAVIQMSDPFYKSIVSQAYEAGFEFVENSDERFEYAPPFKKENPSIFLSKIEDDFFRLSTQPLVKKTALKKLSKDSLFSILQVANSSTFRSSIALSDDYSLILKNDQLSSTLDIPEIKSMIESLINDFLILKKQID